MQITKQVTLFLGLTALSGAVHAVDLTSIGTMDGREFFVSTDVYNASDASDLAASIGGNLASILSQGEQDWIIDPSRTGDKDRFWIGYTRHVFDGPFSWDDGAAVGYENWYANEPNNSGDERNTVMNWGSTGNHGQWNDWGSENNARALVTVAEPEPGSIASLALGAGLLIRRRRRS